VSWRRPGLRGALLYGALATAASGAVAAVARLESARRSGRRGTSPDLPAGPVIVISNHTSYADGILLALACRERGRNVRLLATAGVFRVPVLGSAIRVLGFIPVARGSSAAADSLDAAAEALAEGEAVGLFPEGRITRDAGKWPERAKTGAVRLALRTGAPIVPVAMDGAHEVVGDRAHLLRTMRNLVLPPEVRILVGEPISVSELVAARGGADDEAVVRAVADDVMSRLIDLVEELRGQVAEHQTGVPRSAD
jgi:1-acyl-sn-glycerol-3-phosphate acyltransferase